MLFIFCNFLYVFLHFYAFPAIFSAEKLQKQPDITRYQRFDRTTTFFFNRERDLQCCNLSYFVAKGLKIRDRKSKPNLAVFGDLNDSSTGDFLKKGFFFRCWGNFWGPPRKMGATREPSPSHLLQ